ncbi:MULTISPECIES: helix-turn-helix domain-containing protein [unclassified Microbacterium]|uniref:helix-turn-helix domain-containing protein n=1 Tax=unclassified Microbacterium TaxID=2609290 RepID=UPI001EF86F16|nr:MULTISPECIES: helix-turn-helix domain-containing protein [unclassified Microbacterium]
MNDSSIADVVMHPVRLRIIQQLGGRNVTTAQLRAALPDVTQATLYRHVATLVDAGILSIVEERRVRGAVERTLALGDRMAHVDQAELRAMSDAQLRSAFLAFLGDLSADFDRFVDSEDEILRDFVGFGRVPLYVDAAGLAAIQAGLSELLAPYLSETRDAGRRRVSLATVLVPEPQAHSSAD